MNSRVRSGVVVFLLLVLGGGVLSVAQQRPEQPPRAAQDEFVPIDQLPPGDTLPAAPFLIAAYAVAWLAIAAYLWSIRRRLARVERELSEVGRRAGGSASVTVRGREGSS